ncbi:MAG: LPS export ABC transporter periplasmic protein LptC [Xanthomonadales bacterium]|nr:LPS export ABC transporter periplasmic protein LptC [Xanthomonadales bacterium]NIN59047.1 LPS export ABC transporter periplasmic protein LptC [Xanthomonadales bacterium]NIN74351.1 LPS export ABC transporter periplasmic protein LptC [Xanthomonadales bacterium]NIO13936.1 LPS export ABC transporter periplasmic protein LptC [Xanthomonadales bacterium]NIP11440.1 LPS export ABC transporter periplasmic protein LptC [Xanthomonadales bacterium]
MFTLASLWMTREEEEFRREPIAGLNTQLDYALHEFEARFFDTAGKPAALLTAPTLTNEAATGLALVEQPRIRVFHEGKLWNIRAESATVPPDREIVVLNGRVDLLRHDQGTADRLEITASEVVLHVEPRVASSERHVILQTRLDRLEADGFSVDMIDDTFTLKHAVRGHYEIN